MELQSVVALPSLPHAPSSKLQEPLLKAWEEVCVVNGKRG